MPAVRQAVALALKVFETRPAALITDIDGTISRIVPRPEDAVVSEKARLALAGLSKRLDLVAVITAREEAVARQMVGASGLVYVGNYALDAGARSGLDKVNLETVRSRSYQLTEALPCVTIEEKGVSFALHYRNCDEPDAVRLQLLDFIGPLAEQDGGRLLEGKRVVEVVPATLPDKGTAIAGLVEKHGIKAVVYLGDDVSDLAAFREIDRRRSRGLAGLTVAVLDRETPEAVTEESAIALAGVDAAEEFLTRLAEAMEDRAWQQPS